MPSVYVKTLGCKVNTFDGHAIENQFKAKGYELTSNPDHADVTVVNTCSVTANADKEARYLARRLRRDSPETVLIFTGCYAQTDSARLAAMDEVDFVIPNEVKDKLVEIVDQGISLKKTGETVPKLPLGLKEVKDNRQTHFKSSVTLFDEAHSEQTRAFVKVQDGCDGFCAYCLIPYARGKSRSVPSELVIKECKRLVSQGALELVLTGIHIGDYGRDLEEFAGEDRPIVSLLKELAAIPGMRRLRISSLEPRELTPELVALMQEHNNIFCDHLHLPLQSGTDRILKLMRRTYDTAGYRDSVEMFRKAFPHACIGADVIPGFPQETEEEHEATIAFIRELKLSYLHVFPYSMRPNTSAAKMPGHLSSEVVKRRAKELRDLSEELSRAYYAQFVGQSVDVLWESDLDPQGRRLGHTPNYLNVVCSDQTAKPQTISKVVLKGFVAENRLLGRHVTI